MNLPLCVSKPSPNRPLPPASGCVCGCVGGCAHTHVLAALGFAPLRQLLIQKSDISGLTWGIVLQSVCRCAAS